MSVAQVHRLRLPQVPCSSVVAISSSFYSNKVSGHPCQGILAIALGSLLSVSALGLGEARAVHTNRSPHGSQQRVAVYRVKMAQDHFCSGPATFQLSIIHARSGHY